MIENEKALAQIIEDISIRDGSFLGILCVESGRLGDGFFVQIQHDEASIATGEHTRWTGRKWFIPRTATKSQVVQTVLGAALAYIEHELREAFLYRGVAVFGPHFNVDALHRLSSAQGAMDVGG